MLIHHLSNVKHGVTIRERDFDLVEDMKMLRNT